MNKEPFINYLAQSVFLAAFVAVIFGHDWVDEILTSWGYEGSSFFSSQIFIGFGLWLLVMVLVYIINYGLYRAGIDKAARVGAWMAALFGSRVGKIATREWGHSPFQEEIITILILLVFSLGYWIGQKRIGKGKNI